MEDSDVLLVQKYLGGDENAFSVTVERHIGSVLNFAYHLTGTRDDAEDIVQETFLKAWKHLKTYRPEKSFKTWLYAIARNTAIDVLRKKKNLPFSAFETDEGENTLTDALVDPAPLSNELSILSEDSERLRVIVLKLPFDYRTVILLRYSEDLTFDEIGKILGKPLHTVKSQHRRALVKLRTLFGFLHAPNQGR